MDLSYWETHPCFKISLELDLDLEGTMLLLAMIRKRACCVASRFSYEASKIYRKNLWTSCIGRSNLRSLLVFWWKLRQCPYLYEVKFIENFFGIAAKRLHLKEAVVILSKNCTKNKNISVHCKIGTRFLVCPYVSLKSLIINGD